MGWVWHCGWDHGVTCRDHTLLFIMLLRSYLRPSLALGSPGWRQVCHSIASRSLLDVSIFLNLLGLGADRIFVSSEAVVRGFNKKGKQFLTFDTNLTEPIATMYVGKQITPTKYLQ